MNGPGFSLFAVDDAAVKMRAPSLYAVPSSYVVDAQSSAIGQQMMITALTAALALGVIWFMGKKR